MKTLKAEQGLLLILRPAFVALFPNWKGSIVEDVPSPTAKAGWYPWQNSPSLRRKGKEVGGGKEVRRRDWKERGEGKLWSWCKVNKYINLKKHGKGK